MEKSALTEEQQGWLKHFLVSALSVSWMDSPELIISNAQTEVVNFSRSLFTMAKYWKIWVGLVNYKFMLGKYFLENVLNVFPALAIPTGNNASSTKAHHVRLV